MEQKYAGRDEWLLAMSEQPELLRAYRDEGTFETLHLGKEIEERVLNFLYAWPRAAKRIEVEEGHELFCSRDGILYAYAGTELMFCPPSRAGDIEIPEGVEWIAANVMRRMDIGRLKIPTSFIGIDDDMQGRMYLGTPYRAPFKGSKIKEVVFGDGIEAIPDSMFREAKIGSVKLPKSLKKIGRMAFQDCGIAHAELPDGMKEIGHSAFSGCNIEEVIIPASMEFVGARAFGPCVRHVKASGEKPLMGLIEAVTTSDPVGPDGWPVIIEMGGTKFAIPSRLLPFLDTKEFIRQWDDGYINMNLAKKMCLKTHSADLAIDTALEALVLDPGNQIARKHVTACKGSAALRYLKNKDYGRIAKMAATSVLSRDEAAEIVGSIDDTVGAAQILEAVKSLDDEAAFGL